MLPRDRRLRRPDDFRAVGRSRIRAAGRLVVVQVLPGEAAGNRSRVGFVVSKAVGNSVVRHRVVRRLREIMRTRLDECGRPSDLVVRALPAAAQASSTELAADLDAAIDRAGRRATTGKGRGR